MNALHESIDAHAERAKEEIHLMARIAIKQLRRMAEYPARSAGQRKRYANQVGMRKSRS